MKDTKLLRLEMAEDDCRVRRRRLVVIYPEGAVMPSAPGVHRHQRATGISSETTSEDLKIAASQRAAESAHEGPSSIQLCHWAREALEAGAFSKPGPQPSGLSGEQTALQAASSDAHGQVFRTVIGLLDILQLKKTLIRRQIPRDLRISRSALRDRPRRSAADAREIDLFTPEDLIPCQMQLDRRERKISPIVVCYF